jgi:hypothetical protein
VTPRRLVVFRFVFLGLGAVIVVIVHSSIL